jgi:23S rRNA (uracil1939-C5)-methyltransferase
MAEPSGRHRRARPGTRGRRRTGQPSAPSAEIDLDLTALAYGGEALGRDAAGRVVFVSFALPGERVRVQLLTQRKRWARGRLLQVLQPAGERVSPRCMHYGSCGGCHYQHLAYPAQLRAKEALLRGQLQRLGKIPDPPVEPCLPAPSPWNTRNALQFHLDPAGRLGFVRSGQAEREQTPQPVGRRRPGAADPQVLPIQECHLPEPALAALWPLVDLEQVPGLERVGLRVGRGGQAMLILHGQAPPQVDLDLELPVSVVWLWPGGLQVLAGAEHLTLEVAGREFRVSAPSFFQVQTRLAGELVRLVLEGAAVRPGEVAYDLYAGVGLFSRFLAEAGSRVAAVEQSRWACEDFQHNLGDLEGVELYEATVEEALPDMPSAPQAVVVDPPRAGLAPEVIDQLIRRAPPRLVYVSCDPATLARDAARLQEGGFRLERAVPVDLFPQTYHIEAVTHWRRIGAVG